MNNCDYYNYFCSKHRLWVLLRVASLLIRITCPCVLYPLTTHFYIVKLGFTGVYIICLFVAPKHILWVLNEAVLTCTHNICLEQKYENSQTISTENCHFYSRKKSLYIAWTCFRNVLYTPALLHKSRVRGGRITITQTRPCNILQYFTAVNMIIFR